MRAESAELQSTDSPRIVAMANYSKAMTTKDESDVMTVPASICDPAG